MGEKIGGQLHPDKIVEIEHEEVRQEFLKLKKPYDNEIFKLDHERAKVRLQQEDFERAPPGKTRRVGKV